MSVAAIIEDGKIANTSSTTSTASAKGSSMDKDDFLQLLVAQMKYQDPLEPTSNTEYIAQYATFSQVEQMQNMSQSMDLNRASGLVGQTVQITSTDDNGKETTTMGKVDYVKYENGKAMLSIDESLYPLEDVTYVCDSEYLTAYNLAQSFATEYAKLPELDKVILSDKDSITKVLEAYDEMSDYQKTFLASSIQEAVEDYREKLEQVVKAAEESADINDDTVNGDTQES